MDESIARLMNMGFEFDMILNALNAANNNESLAVQYLIEGTTSNQRRTRMNRTNRRHRTSTHRTTKISKSKSNTIIEWIEGRDNIYNKGIQPFFARIDKIFDNDKDECSKTYMIPQEIYTYCYDYIFSMCIQREPYNHSKQLYDFHAEALTNYFVSLLKHLNTLKNELKYGYIGYNDIKYVECFIVTYKKCQVAIKGMHTIFHYLNRYHVPNTDGTMEINVHAFSIYFHKIFSIHSSYIIHIIFKYINLCRDYDLFNKPINDLTNIYDYYQIKELIFQYIDIIWSLNKSLNDDKTGNVESIRNRLNLKKNKLLPFGYLHDVNIYFHIEIPKEINNIIIQYYGNPYSTMTIYEQYFYKIFQVETHKYYKNKCKEMSINGITIIQYIHQCQKCIEYEKNQFNSNRVRNVWNTVVDKLYDEQIIDNLWKTNSYFLMDIDNNYNIYKYAINIYKSLDLLKNNHKIFELIMKNIKYDITNVFNKYLKISKKNTNSKNIYTKYKLIYDTFDIYKGIINIYYKNNDIGFKAKIQNGFYLLFAKVIENESDYICNLLAMFSNYILMNAHFINYHIDELMDYVVFIYQLIRFTDPNLVKFIEKYKYFQQKRYQFTKYKTSYKSMYFEQKLLQKLQNEQLNECFNNLND